MTQLATVDVETGEIVGRTNGTYALPALPDEPSYLPTAKLATACQQIFERREEIVGTATVEEAIEALHRAGAIEKYVRAKEHKDVARRAARVLETAVGAALGLAEHGGDRKSNQVVRGQLEIAAPDRSRFRLMAAYREAWWPRLQEKALSRKQVLTIIDWMRRPPASGDGDAVVTHAEATGWLETVAPADLLLTDPPYSTDVADVATFASWFPLALTKLKPSARAFVFIGAYAEELATYFSTPLPDGWQWGVPHAWVYRNAIGPTPDRDFIRNWQCMLTAYGPEAGPLQTDRITELLAGFVENAPDGRHAVKHHKWEKPLELIQRLVRVSTKAGDLVIDPFSGSGTTLVAAKAEGRRGFGCDIDEKAVAIAVERGCNEI